MGRLQGKKGIVTGAAKGIGRAIAETFASEGADLMLITRTSSLDEVLVLCAEKGVNAVCMAGDVSDPLFAKSVIEKTKEEFGKIDILVNNAGVTRDNLLVRMKDSEFDDVVATNLKGAFNLLRPVAKVMMRQRQGTIINISSVVGLSGNAGQVNYAATKAGLIGMTKSAALELGGRGITVNAIAPGFIATDMTEALPEKTKADMIDSIPLGRFGDVADIAAGALFLASDEGKYITGETLSINGGMYM